MLAKLFLQYVMAVVFGVGIDEGFATRYGTPDDKFAQGNMACVKTRVPQDRAYCAHRWLPCGTEVIVMNLERGGAGSCIVTDRGPYGVDGKSGLWRGILDMTPHAARSVRLDGRDKVRVLYRLPDPGHKAYGDRRFLEPDKRSRSKFLF